MEDKKINIKNYVEFEGKKYYDDDLNDDDIPLWDDNVDLITNKQEQEEGGESEGEKSIHLNQEKINVDGKSNKENKSDLFKETDFTQKTFLKDEQLEFNFTLQNNEEKNQLKDVEEQSNENKKWKMLKNPFGMKSEELQLFIQLDKLKTINDLNLFLNSLKEKEAEGKTIYLSHFITELNVFFEKFKNIQLIDVVKLKNKTIEIQWFKQGSSEFDNDFKVVKLTN